MSDQIHNRATRAVLAGRLVSRVHRGVSSGIRRLTGGLPIDAPVLGILHTITGGSHAHRGFMKYAANRGWRSCVLNRRGHSGMTLKIVPHFSVMGNVDDTVLMVDRMRKHYPNNFIGLAGISAGSGQVVSYIGREGDQVKVDAAASLCPAWDISVSFAIKCVQLETLTGNISVCIGFD